MEKYIDWQRVIGLPVEIRKDGETVTTGVVDEAMPDSSIVWLAPHGARHRTLYEAEQQYEVWVDPTAAANNNPSARTSLGVPEKGHIEALLDEAAAIARAGRVIRQETT